MSLLLSFLLDLCHGEIKNPETYIISASKIYTSGERGILLNSKFLVRNGKFMDIGQSKGLSDIPVLEFPNAVITPGFVDAHSFVSGFLSLQEDTLAVISDFPAFRAFDPLHPEVKQALSEGITTIHLSPGNGNLAGGISSILKPGIRLGGSFILKKNAFLKISFLTKAFVKHRPPTSVMGAPLLLDNSIFQAKRDTNEPQKELFPQKGIDLLIRGELQPCLYASWRDEIKTALQWLKKNSFKGFIVGGEEASFLASDLMELQIPICHSPLTFSMPQKLADNAAELIQKGILLAFVTHMPETRPLSLRMSALLIHRQGISVEEALKTITINPARILDIGNQTGSIESGKDADFIVFSGDPLDMQSRILAVYQNGRLVFKSDEQEGRQ